MQARSHTLLTLAQQQLSAGAEFQPALHSGSELLSPPSLPLGGEGGLHRLRQYGLS